jgi:hypothetical protein
MYGKNFGLHYSEEVIQGKSQSNGNTRHFVLLNLVEVRVMKLLKRIPPVEIGEFLEQK